LKESLTVSNGVSNGDIPKISGTPVSVGKINWSELRAPLQYLKQEI